MERLIAFLKERIHPETPLNEIVDAFEAMCQTPLADDLILFETGSFNFFPDPTYLFSLVRQFPNGDDDEFYQLHVDLAYPADPDTPQETTWQDDVEGSIFDHIRASAAYAYAIKRKPSGIEIYCTET